VDVLCCELKVSGSQPKVEGGHTQSNASHMANATTNSRPCNLNDVGSRRLALVQMRLDNENTDLFRKLNTSDFQGQTSFRRKLST